MQPMSAIKLKFRMVLALELRLDAQDVADGVRETSHRNRLGTGHVQDGGQRIRRCMGELGKLREDNGPCPRRS